MTHGRLRPTFRDPAGSLSLEDNQAVRTIRAAARDEVLEFLASPFRQRMEARGDMVGTTVEDTAEGLRLLHPRVAVPTYPWEWTPSQWLAAAELTLALGEEALGEGWILKDATPLNILFIGSRPVLVDVLSFAKRDPSSAVWLAYGQYLRTFLLPLMAHQMLSWPLELSLLRRDGYEPSELYAAMGWGQRMSRAAFWPVTLPAWLEKKKGEQGGAPAATRKTDPDAATHILKKMLGNLRARTQRAVKASAASEWSEYTATLTHYTAEQAAAKKQWVSAVLDEVKPQRVLDVGANTGEFSALVAGKGMAVVALERDASAAERLYAMSRAKGLEIQTIHADLSRPTPAVGWENAESSALLERLDGQFDLAMLLAVIHHLVLMEQIPLDAILELCTRLTRKHLIVEWVPVEDPMFQSLMRGRNDLYGALSEDDLMAACVGRFELLRRQPVGNGRILLLFEKTSS
jgi:SAM-dependent methyltransferase